MTDLRDNDEPRPLRPHERDPDAEPPHVDECDVWRALDKMAAEVCGADGSTYLTEFACNLGVRKLNAMFLQMYKTENSELRADFAASFGDNARNRLRDTQ